MGVDTATGTQAAPFRQITTAIRNAKPGDSIYVGDGTYDGFTVADFAGTASSPLTIKAVGTNCLIAARNTDTDHTRGNVYVLQSSYVVVDGLRTFGGAGKLGAGIAARFSPHVAIRNCVSGNNARWAIFTSFCDSAVIENNDAFGSSVEHGIYFSNSADHPVIRGNRVHDNRMCGIHVNGDRSSDGGGMYSGIPDGIITDALICNNVIYANGVAGGSGINLDGVQDSMICNNLLYNNHRKGIAAYVIDGSGGPNGLRIAHNTIEMAADSQGSAIQMRGTRGQIIIRDNILLSLADGGSLDIESADLGNVDSDYNIMVGRISLDDSTTGLAQWQAHGKDAHSFAAPRGRLFVNADRGDYHLVAGSPAIARGSTQVLVSADADGRRRPARKSADIGCYQYEAAPARHAHGPAVDR